MSKLAILATGLVSLLSIPDVIYHPYLLIFRTYLCTLYLFVDCFRTKKRTFENNIIYIIHHISSLYLIFNKNNCDLIVNKMFFLEFGSFIGHLTRYYNKGKFISKIYWVYDRIYNFPYLIIKYKDCIHNHIFAFYVLQFIGYIWTMEVIKYNKYKYILSSIYMIILINYHNTIRFYI